MTEDSAAERVLYVAWQEERHIDRVRILADLPVPGPIALRSRYRHLHDPTAPEGPLHPDVSWADWLTVLQLETDGDQAVQRGDLDDAHTAFATLARYPAPPQHRVVQVHAQIGLGDIARARDEVEAAITAYEQALDWSIADHYRFGALRALVPLGYLTLAYHSATAAQSRFTEAYELAEALADPLYRANAALGLAECAERHGDLARAIEGARSAFAGFAEIGTWIGQANAAHRLGALLHRAEQPEEAGLWLRRAHDWYEQTGDPVGRTNVLSGLGDLYLDAHEFDAAERWYAEGLRVAEAARLPRATAHALQDVARVARGRGHWAEALSRFAAALAAYRRLDDVNGMWHALDKMAEAYSELGDLPAVVRTRLEAVVHVEQFRASHRDDAAQREYRDRFRETYSKALIACIDNADAPAFAVVADCLAGRRLAGLIEAAPPATDNDIELLQELLVRADQHLLHRRRGKSAAPEDTRREERIRLLGTVAIRHGLAPRSDSALEDLLAAVYLPPERDGTPLLAAAPVHAHLWQLLVDPVDPRLVHWLWRAPGQTPRLGTAELTDECRGLLHTLIDAGDDRLGLRLTDLRSLGCLLPPGLAESMLASPGPALVVIPVGELWAIPWSAFPLTSTTTLGEHARFAVCPSLTVQRVLSTRAGDTRTTTEVDLWCSPAVGEHWQQLLTTGGRLRFRALGSSQDARTRLKSGGDMMVVIGHGRPSPGLGHYLELDDNDWLLPADVLRGAPPRRLVMLACWVGAIGQSRPNDPISLATLALAARSDEVLATVFELGDSPAAAAYADRIIAGMAALSLPDAVHAATRWLLAQEGGRHLPIHHWAPLVPFGTVTGDPVS